jgi:hypothetical protein
VQFRGRQFLLEQGIRKGEALATPVGRKAPVNQVGHHHQAELETLGLVHRHQVHRVEAVIEWRDLLVGLGGLGQVQVVQVGPQVMVPVLVAVGCDQLGQLLHIGADLEPLDRSAKAIDVEVAGLLHHLVEEVIDADPLGHEGEGAEVMAESLWALLARTLQQVVKATTAVSCLARPAAGEHRVEGISRQGEQPHQANNIVGGVDRAQHCQAVLDFRLLVKATTAAHLVGNPFSLERTRKVVQVGVGS